jgi:hypothetical protein
MGNRAGDIGLAATIIRPVRSRDPPSLAYEGALARLSVAKRQGSHDLPVEVEFGSGLLQNN